MQTELTEVLQCTQRAEGRVRMWSEPLQTYSMQVVGDLASAELRPASPLLPPSQLRDSPTFEAFVPVSYHPQYLLRESTARSHVCSSRKDSKQGSRTRLSRAG